MDIDCLDGWRRGEVRELVWLYSTGRLEFALYMRLKLVGYGYVSCVNVQHVLWVWMAHVYTSYSG